ncbi:MAG: protein kinase [Bacteroidota bacterium]
MNTDNAADNLLGLTLQTGWKVIAKINRLPNATGSFFSVCYKVEKEGEICFLKALNFGAFFSNNNGKKNITEVLTEMLEAHKYEKRLSELCKKKHASKIIFVKDSGEVNVDGYTISLVPYLIFDLADGDVRSQINLSNKLDFTWRLQSLHDIAVGIKQLHQINISHQDIKPSNILLFKQDSKIGDLGRSLCFDVKSPYDDLAFSGDWNYAPPEIIYQYYEKDMRKRSYAIDCYLLGSILVYYFLGISMTALLMRHIPEPLKYYNWKGTFEEIQPYLINSFSDALIEFSNNIENEYFKKELQDLVERLCFPIPDKRGHIKILNSSNPFNLERVITKFDVLHTKAKIKFFGVKS